MNRHTKCDGTKPYICYFKDCDYQTTKYLNLAKHILTHDGNKGFECNQCNQGFNYQSLLRKHQKMHQIN